MGNTIYDKTSSSNTILAFWILFGKICVMLMGIISAAILSRYLSKHEYGTYRQIIYIYTTLSVLFSAGLPKVFAYYLPKYSIPEGKDIVWKVTKVLLLFGFCFSLFLYSGSGMIAHVLKNPELTIGLKIFSPIPFFFLPTLGIEGIFSTYKKTYYVALYNVITKSMGLLFIVLPVIIFNGDYKMALYGWLVISFLSMVLAFYFKKIPYKNISTVSSGLSLKKVFSYSLPIVLASLWGILISMADQFYISRYYGSEVFAEFSNGFIEVPFVSMVTASASVVLMPLFSKLVDEKKQETEIVSIWNNVLQKSALIIYPIVVFFIFYSKHLMVLLYSAKYMVSAKYFQINVFSNLFNIVVFAPLLLALGKTKLYANTHMILALMAWGLGYLVVTTTNSPIHIAVFSTALKICKIVVFVFLIAKIMRIRVMDLFPIKSMLLILAHNLLIGFIVYYASKNLMFFEENFVGLLFSLVLFIVLVLSSSKLFKLDYMMVIKPILLKMKHKFFK